MQLDTTHRFMIKDAEAHRALWMAICEAGNKLAGRCSVYVSRAPEPTAKLGRQVETPEVETWKLVEALSLLAILINAEEVGSSEVSNLFGKTGPIQISEDGQARYLWAQPSLIGQQSALGGRPDLIVTSTPDPPSPATVQRVVECKCRQRLGAHEIRSEFGKAHDLRVVSYLIGSLTSPAPKVVEGARRLGLDLVALGFDTPWRADLIKRPENLVAHVANTLAVSKREERFARKLLESGIEATLKIGR
jgi:hypothetical protein